VGRPVAVGFGVELAGAGDGETFGAATVVDGAAVVAPPEQAAMIKATTVSKARDRVTLARYAKASAGAMALERPSAADTGCSAQVAPRRGMSPTRATTRRSWLFKREPKDRPLDLVELQVGGPPGLTEAQLPIAAGARRQEAVKQPPHDRPLPLVHCALLRG
jgi:hypothetical protein